MLRLDGVALAWGEGPGFCQLALAAPLSAHSTQAYLAASGPNLNCTGQPVHATGAPRSPWEGRESRVGVARACLVILPRAQAGLGVQVHHVTLMCSHDWELPLCYLVANKLNHGSSFCCILQQKLLFHCGQEFDSQAV